MADPHLMLAPLIEPPLVAEPAAAAPQLSGPWVAAAVVGLVLLALFLRWRRGAPRRDLRRIARTTDAVAGAHQLALWLRTQQRAAPEEWRQALDRLRFGPPAEDAGLTLDQLCRTAATFGRAR